MYDRQTGEWKDGEILVGTEEEARRDYIYSKVTEGYTYREGDSNTPDSLVDEETGKGWILVLEEVED